MNPAAGARLRGAALVVAAAMSALALAEAGLRIARYPFRPAWIPTENALAVFDPELGWSYRPGLSREVDFEGRRRPVHFDDAGLRVPAPGTELRSDVPTVLLIGGSYTMGHGLSWEESLAGKLSSLLPGWQVVNAGVQGYGTDQSLLALQRHVGRFDTRAVVYTFIESHHRRNASYDRRILYPTATFLGTKPRFRVGPDGRPLLARAPVRYEDYRHSWLVDLVRVALAARRSPPSESTVQLTRSLIREMAAVSDEHGAGFLVVSWRWGGEADPVFDDLGAPVVDVLDDAPADWAHWTLPRDDHPGPRACGRVARMIRDAIDPAAGDDPLRGSGPGTRRRGRRLSPPRRPDSRRPAGAPAPPA